MQSTQDEQIERIQADVCEKLSGCFVYMWLSRCGNYFRFVVKGFTDVGKLEVSISSGLTLENYHAEFGSSFLYSCVSHDCTLSLLEKIFPLIGYYKIQHKVLEILWKEMIEYGPEFNMSHFMMQLMAGISSKKFPPSQLALEMKNARRIHELTIVVRHFQYFRLLDGLGKNVLYAHPFKRKLLLFEEGRIRISSPTSSYTQEMRRIIYLKSMEYRNLLFRFFSEEMFLVIQFSRDLLSDVQAGILYIFVLVL